MVFLSLKNMCDKGFGGGWMTRRWSMRSSVSLLNFLFCFILALCILACVKSLASTLHLYRHPSLCATDAVQAHGAYMNNCSSLKVHSIHPPHLFIFILHIGNIWQQWSSHLKANLHVRNLYKAKDYYGIYSTCALKFM